MDIIPVYTTLYLHQRLEAEMQQVWNRVYSSNWYVLGNEVQQFEKAYAAFSQTAYAIGTGNGLDALVLCLKALNIGKGHEVIVPANTYIAGWLAVSHAGATPVPVEPDAETCNINTALVEAAITPLTKAIMPVHLYGNPADMEALQAIATRHNLHIIEDDAHSHTASLNGRPTGSFGICNATSFYPSKTLGALGDGGAVTTSNAHLADTVSRLRNYGRTSRYTNSGLGINSRLDELQAAVLSLKLQTLEWVKTQQQEIATLYRQELNNVGDISFQRVIPGAVHGYHLFVIFTTHRDALRKFLLAQGVETQVHYPVASYAQQAYAHLNLSSMAFPVTEKLNATCLSLPLYPGMEKNTQLAVISVIKRYFSV